MRDRRAQFCWQYLDDLARIRAGCPSRSLNSTLAVYLTLTELVSIQHRTEHDEAAVASRKQVAESAGVSVRTLDMVVTRLREIGLLGIERRREGDTDLPSRYCLLPRATTSPPEQKEAPNLHTSRAGETTTTQTQTGANAPNARAKEPDGFADWLEHHCRVTGRSVMAKEGTQARARVAAMYAQRRDEYPEDDLRLISLGAMADERRREQGYTDPESVLRPMAVPKLLARGRDAGAGSQHASELERAIAAAPQMTEAEAEEQLAEVGL